MIGLYPEIKWVCQTTLLLNNLICHHNYAEKYYYNSDRQTRF